MIATLNVSISTQCTYVHRYTFNTELNDMRKLFLFRKSEVSIERISVCNGIVKFIEHWVLKHNSL